MSAHAYHPHCGCYDCGLSEEADEAQAARAAEIVDAWMADPVKVAGAIDELAGTSDLNSDANTHFAADLAAVIDSNGPDALRYLERLRRKVRDYFQNDAQTQAWAEAEQFRLRGEEGRRAA